MKGSLTVWFDEDAVQKYSVGKFIGTINTIKFESLCVYYVELLGCETFRVTRRSSDQGLDFYGIHPFNEYSFFGSVSKKVFLIGQTKLYTEKVGTGNIRDVCGFD